MNVCLYFTSRRNIKKLTATLGITKAELLRRIQEVQPGKKFKKVFVIADEQTRYVVIATYEVDYFYRGHPPSVAFAVNKDDSRIAEIDHMGYGLGAK